MPLNPTQNDIPTSSEPRSSGRLAWRESALFVLLALALFVLLSGVLPRVRIAREIRALLGVGWILASATALGLWFAERGRGSLCGRELLRACGLGVGIFAYGMFLLAALGLWTDAWVWGMFLSLQLLAAPNGLPLYRSLLARSQGGQEEPWSVLQVAGAVFGGIAAAILLLYALLPPMSFDALEYHLGVPWAYWQGGGMRFLPHLFYSNFPMNVEMAFTLGWRIAGEGGVKVLHWAFGVLTAGGVYVWLRGSLGRSGALLGALLFFTSGPVIGLAVSAKIDLLLTFFSFLAFEAFWRWLHGGTRRDGILSGVFCGLAVGSKYSALGVLAIPLALGILLSLLARVRQKAQWRILLYFALAVLVLFSPWAVRNLLYQGNPVFPLGYGLFGGKTMDDEINAFMKVTTDATWPEEVAELVSMDSFLRRLSHLWFILTRREEIPTLFLFLCIPLLALAKERRDMIGALVLLLGWMVWLFLSRPLARYLVPLYPPMAGLLLLTLGRIRRQVTVRVAWALLALLLVGNFLRLSVLPAQLPGAPRYLSRQVSRERFLFGPLPHFEAIEFLNQRLHSDAVRVLFVAEARGYGCKVPYDLNTVYDRAILLQVIGEEQRAELWPRLLRNAGYTHLLYNPIELRRYRRTFESSGWKEGERLERVMQSLERTRGLRLLFLTHPTPAGQLRVYEIVEQS